MEKKTAEQMQKIGELVFMPEKDCKKYHISATVAYKPADSDLVKGKKQVKSLLTRLFWALAKAQQAGTKADATIPISAGVRACVVPFSETNTKPVVIVFSVKGKL
jgi:hypothetical protein